MSSLQYIFTFRRVVPLISKTFIKIEILTNVENTFNKIERVCASHGYVNFAEELIK